MNISKIREDFTILQKGINGKPVIYFDNACMTLKPKQVVDKVNEYYNEYPACAERSYHKLGKRATEEYETSRKKIQKFLNAKSDKEIIFTKNTTEGLNLVAKSYKFHPFDIIIQTDKEHNSNLTPFYQISKEKNLVRTNISTQDGFDMKNFEQLLSSAKKTNHHVMVSMVHTSNMDGTTIPAREIIRMTHEYNGLVLLDAAQSIPHRKIDVKKLDVDFLAFSGHKMLGPTGTGVLYGKEEHLEKLAPFMTGGSTVDDTRYDYVEYTHLPERFEAGLQNYAGFIGLGAAVDYLQKYVGDIEEHELKLNKLATDSLKNDVDILGGIDPDKRSGIFSFNTKNKMDYHEVALLLDSYANVMIRSGRHCVHSWFNGHNINGSARASFYLYNTEEEVKVFVEKLREIVKMKK
jgi:cysteine desulfurase / selenocysteine lyase